MIKSGTARDMAKLAHRDQTDKNGEPYFWHVERVASAVATAEFDMTGTHDDELFAIGYLHDIVEDTDTTFTDLQNAGASLLQLQAIKALTRTIDETYAEYIERVVLHPVARKVKLADLHDNMRPDRVVTGGSRSLLARYTKAYERVVDATLEVK